MNNAPINLLIKHLEWVNKHFTAVVLRRPTGVPVYYRQVSVRNQIHSQGVHSRLFHVLKPSMLQQHCWVPWILWFKLQGTAQLIVLE